MFITFALRDFLYLSENMPPLPELAPQGDKTTQKKRRIRMGNHCLHAMKKDMALSNDFLAATLCGKTPRGC